MRFDRDFEWDSIDYSLVFTYELSRWRRSQKWCQIGVKTGVKQDWNRVIKQQKGS